MRTVVTCKDRGQYYFLYFDSKVCRMIGDREILKKERNLKWKCYVLKQLLSTKTPCHWNEVPLHVYMFLCFRTSTWGTVEAKDASIIET